MHSTLEAQSHGEGTRTETDITQLSDSLFSFELFVHAVDKLVVPCHSPAVGFRFLDFPSVIIYQKWKKDVENLHGEVRQNYVSGGGERILETEHGSLEFNKGKSSLFRMDLSMLCNLLSNIPVYIMLLDVFHSKPKLLGSCSISLKSAVEKVKKMIEGNENILPSIIKKKLSLNVFNLMGTAIGNLTMTYTFYSYGTSLNKHINKSETNRFDLLYNKSIKESDENDEKDITKFNESLDSEKLARKLKKLDKATETVVGNFSSSSARESNENDRKHVEKDMQSVNKPKNLVMNNILSMHNHGIEHDRDNNDIYCPPPLFFTSVKDVNSWKNSSVERTPFGENHTLVSDPPQPLSKVHSQGPSKSSNYPAGMYYTEVITEDPDIYHEVMKPHSYESAGISKKQNEDTHEVPEKDPVKYTDSLSQVMDSLNDLPMLQGILKEIISFSKQHLGEKSSSVQEEIKDSKEIEQNMLAKSKHTQKIDSKNRKDVNTDKRPICNPLNEPTGKKKRKKLRFKTTRTYEMRCAMLHERSKEILPNREVDIFEDKIEPKRASHSLNRYISEPKTSRGGFSTQAFRTDSFLPQFSSNEGMNDLSQSSTLSKYINDNHDEDVVHSKSPASIDIHLPDTADGIRNSVESSHSANINIISSSLGQSGIYSPPPLQRKWTGTEDLSRIESLSETKNHDAEAKTSRLNRGRSESDENSLVTLKNFIASERQSPQAMIPGISGVSYDVNDHKDDNDYSDNFDNASASTASRQSHSKMDSMDNSLGSSRRDSLDSDRTPTNASNSKSHNSNSEKLRQSDKLESFHSAKSQLSKIETKMSRDSNDNSAVDKRRQQPLQTSQSRNTDSLRSLSSASRNSVSSKNYSRDKTEDSLESHRSNHSFLESKKSPKSLQQVTDKQKLNLDRRSISRTSVQSNSFSNQSTPRNKDSNISRPQPSRHSPTTSRSLRNKLQKSQHSDGDMTHSINLSNMSLNTGSEYDSIDMDDIDRELGDSPFNT